MLVGSVLRLGVDVWGCGRQLRPIEEVQLRGDVEAASTDFSAVGNGYAASEVGGTEKKY